MASMTELPLAEAVAEDGVTQVSGAEQLLAADSAGDEVPAAAAADSGSDAMVTPDSAEVRSVRTQTQPEQPATEPQDAVDSAAPDRDRARRRALSDGSILDHRPSTAHIRSERIRRTAQMFEDLAAAQEEREAALRVRRGGRRGAAPLGVPAVPPPEREVLLIPLPTPPPTEQSRRVDAILALGSSDLPADSDAEGDEEDDEMLWEKVRAKIAARRSKFKRLESGQDEPRQPAAARQNPHRLSAERTGWLSNGKQAAAPAKQQAAAPAKQQVAAAAERKQAAAPQQQQQQQQQPARPARVLTAQYPPAQNGHAIETTRSSSGKYIEQSTEQEVLRCLGSAVLARQRLAAKEKARTQLVSDRSEAERRLKKAANQRVDAQSRLQKTKGKLTRDSAFERKGLEHLITRLDGNLREEVRKMDKLAVQITDIDAEIEELRRRAAT